MSKLNNHIYPLVRIPLRYGLIAGALGSVMYVILYFIGDHPATIYPFFDFRILLFGVFFFFCLKELRDYYFGGLLFFWQGMTACILLTSTFALTASVLVYFFASFREDFVTSFILIETERLRKIPPEEIERLGKNVYEAGLEGLKSVDSFFLARRYFLQSFGISFFVAIIISVISRRQPKGN